MDFEQDFRHPDFHTFPLPRRKFTVWFIAQTLHALIFELEINEATCYTNDLLLKHWNIPQRMRLQKYTNYHKALY